MQKVLRGTTTVEVMTALVAMSLVLITSHGAKSVLFHHYRDVVHRERAQLFAMETFEQLESLRLSRIQQNYRHSWESFLGDKEDGYYQLVPGADVNQWQLIALGNALPVTIDEQSSVRVYASKQQDSGRVIPGFYSRLERRVYVESMGTSGSGREQKRLSVSVYWGFPGEYSQHHSQQIIQQALYADQVGPAFVM